MTTAQDIARGKAIAARRAAARPAAGVDPEASARGRSARRRGADNEARTLRCLVLPFFPKARRTRVGDAGADLHTEGVGQRAMEFTVARWEDLPIKMDQAAFAASQNQATEFVVLKPRQRLPGQRRRWYAIQDGEGYMRRSKELDILRALRAAILAAPSRDKVILASRLAELALDKLAGVTLDDD